MVGCSIRNCKSRSVKGGIIRFFTFPKVDSLARQWLRYCSPNTTAKNGRVCSNHFGPNDYIISLKHTLTKEIPSKTRILKPEAVPNLLTNIEKRKSKSMLNRSPMPLSISVKVESMGEAGSSLNRYSTDSILDMATADIKCNPESPNRDGVSNSDYFELSLDKIKKELKGEKTEDGTAVEVKSDSDSGDDDDPLSHISVKMSASAKRPRCEFNGDRIYASEIAGPSLKKEENSGDKYTVPVAEYRQLKRKMKEYSVLKKNLELIFTPGQIKCLMKPKKNRVTWATEDIVAAISLRKVSPRAYNHLRGKIGIPLPGFSTLCKWAAKCGLDVGSLDREEEPEENKPIQCDVCQKFFKSRPSFVKHCKIHSGVRVICEIQINDSLPQTICTTCTDTLDQVMSFRDTCQRSHDTLMDRSNHQDLFSVKIEPNHQITGKKHRTSIDVKHDCDFDQNDDHFDCQSLTNNDDDLGEINCKKTTDSSKMIEFESTVEEILNKNLKFTFENYKPLKRVKKIRDKVNRICLVKTQENTSPDVAKTIDSCNQIPSHEDIEINPQPSGNKVEEECNQYQCEYCFKIYNNKVSYFNHTKIHTGLKVICEHCGKEFLDKRRLLMHCRSKHGYQKTDKCTFCDYLGISPESVKIHERIHTGEKPYKCKECPASFHRSSSYLQHTARHLPEKTVQCQQCPALFKSVTLMRIHANRHKPRDHKFKCLVCGGNFSSRSSVGRHLRRAHAVARCTQAHLQRVKLNEP